MRNIVQQGDIIPLTASRAVTSGQGMLRGNTFGVALSDTANGAVGEFAIVGVFTLPKATGAINEGVLVYWDNTAFNVTTTASGNTKIGTCVNVGGLASGITSINVRLQPTI